MKKILIFLLFGMLCQNANTAFGQVVFAEKSKQENPVNFYIAPYKDLSNHGLNAHATLIVSTTEYNVWIITPADAIQSDSDKVFPENTDLAKNPNFAFVSEYETQEYFKERNPLMVFVNKAHFVSKDGNHTWYPASTIDNFSDIYNATKMISVYKLTLEMSALKQKFE